MVQKRWDASVVDAPGSEPFAVVGDLVVALRTPRSRDFVTLEVAATSALSGPAGQGEPTRCSKPLPIFSDAWSGEVRPAFPVDLLVAGVPYRLTVDRLCDSPEGPPWVVCDLHIERA